MPKYQSVRGTKDILPADAERFQHLESVSRALFKRFGYQEIRTPTFESVDLFQRSLGETTDVVRKEMYVFEDRGGRKLALRPEGTAGVVRAFIEHHLSQNAPFCKLFYIGPMFRAERPQAGRYREFWQIGAEYFGNASPTADAELLLLVQTLFRELGLTDARLKINSLGDAKCRPKYLEALTAYIKGVKHLCDDCQERVKKNPLRVLDCKIDGPRLTDVPTIDKYWDEDCRAHFEKVQEFLKEAGGEFEVVKKLVRGLDYYTRTVFEVTSRALGAQDALAAGGRYDKLVKDLGGPDVPALGFALGMERAIQASPSDQIMNLRKTKLFIAAIGEAGSSEANRVLQTLRLNSGLIKKDIAVEGGYFDKKIGAQLQLADKGGATHVIILGEDEIKQGKVTLKSLQTGNQKTIEKSALITHLLSLDAEKSLD
jgi:histidyl-tRNA synthetase